jgi:hypothetical protein
MVTNQTSKTEPLLRFGEIGKFVVAGMTAAKREKGKRIAKGSRATFIPQIPDLSEMLKVLVLRKNREKTEPVLCVTQTPNHRECTGTEAN